MLPKLAPSGRTTHQGRSPTRQDNQSGCGEHFGKAPQHRLRGDLAAAARPMHPRGALPPGGVSLEEHRCSPQRKRAQHHTGQLMLFVQSDNWRRCPRCLGETPDGLVTAVCGAIKTAIVFGYMFSKYLQLHLCNLIV